MWEKQPDCYNKLVASTIRRDQMTHMLSCLHFRDNAYLDEDPYYKVRPIFANLNENCKRWFAGQDKFSVDETMVPYFGHHSTKQFIRGKPVRYGYKIWSICTSAGEGVWFEPYCGRATRIHDYGLGQGPNVVLDLVTKAQVEAGSEVFVDNLFTSFPLSDKMSEMGIGLTGTVRQNRLNKVPIVQKKALEKKTVARGTYKAVFCNDQVLIGWKDNKAVFVASNKHGAGQKSNCNRFCRTTRDSIHVPIPDMVMAYNAGMPGVDLLDYMVAHYRVRFRIKKWWWPLYSWSISTSAVNAWRVRRMVTGSKEPLLNFLRELVVTMLRHHGKAPLATGRKVHAPVSIRFDRVDHWIRGTAVDAKGKPARRNCKQCHLEGKKEMKTVFICSKCDVPLHTHCFEKYHTPVC